MCLFHSNIQQSEIGWPVLSWLLYQPAMAADGFRTCLLVEVSANSSSGSCSFHSQSLWSCLFGPPAADRQGFGRLDLSACDFWLPTWPYMKIHIKWHCTHTRCMMYGQRCSVFETGEDLWESSRFWRLQRQKSSWRAPHLCVLITRETYRSNSYSAVLPPPAWSSFGSLFLGPTDVFEISLIILRFEAVVIAKIFLISELLFIYKHSWNSKLRRIVMLSCTSPY